MVVTCDICGREINGEPIVVEIDGAVLTLCQRCASRYANVKGVRVVSGVIQQTPSGQATIKPRQRYITPVRQVKRRSEVNVNQAERLEVIDNYGEVIKDARSRLGMSRDVLASMLGIKESTLRNIEDGKLIPDINLARRMEKVLGVKLLVEREEAEMEFGESGGGEVTLGDIVEIRRKDKEQ
ncbi:MAG: multiprotein bridging factor aMBF1 [Caldivirga sp.]|uniref:multiprotein bridging factor aMBF1 n=1 Tax=Caldivirga sp. TaxID=2080243 RepID=UPI003D0AFCEE